MTANTLIKSLIGYVNDVKPYHSKLRDFTTELFFEDEFNVAVVDNQPELTVGFRNVWGRTEDERLARLSEGAPGDQIIDIPPMVLPRFSLNTFLEYLQTPHGHDPASLSLVDGDDDGKPDIEVPYVLPTDPEALNHLSQSHQLGSNTIPYPVEILSLTYNVTSASEDIDELTYTVDVVAEVNFAEAIEFGIDPTAVIINAQSRFGLTQQVPGTQVYDTIEFTITDTILKSAWDQPADTPDLLTLEQWAEACAHTISFTAFIEDDTGRYAVPFHTGSYIEVNNVPQTLLVDYTVDRRRSVIQFLDGKHPAPSDALAFNLYTSDRLFVAMASPYDYGISRDYDSSPYDMLPYDGTGEVTLESDTFIITIDDVYDQGHQPVVFQDVLPGRSKCVLADLTILTATNGDVWHATAISDYVLSIRRVSPTVTAPEFAFLNQPFNNGVFSFTMTAPWVAYYFDLQTGSYLTAIDDANGDLDTYGWLYDQADYYPNVNIRTEQGVYVDPLPSLHSPVLYNRLGYVKQRIDGSYFLELLEIPPRGTYIEVRVEQTQQYAPRANTGMNESVSIIMFTDEPPHTGDETIPWDGSGDQSIVTIIRANP